MMQSKQMRYILIGVLVSITMIGLGCSEQLKQYFESNEDEIHIALVGPMTGESKSVGKAFANGVRLYVEDVNRRGGVNGKRLVIDTYDDQNKPGLAHDEASRLVEQNRAVAVIGHHYSTCSISAGKIYKEFGIPAISPASTNVSVTLNNPWFFRASFNDNLQGRFLANYAHKVFGQPNVSIICEDDDYGRYLAQTFEETSAALGSTVKHKWKFVADTRQTAARMDQIVRELAAEKDAGVVFLATHAGPGIRLLRLMKEKKILNTLMGPDAFASETFRRGFDEFPKERRSPGYYTNGLYVTTPLIFDTSDAKGQQFRETYRRHYGQVPGWHAAFAYDSALLIVHALRATGAEGTPETIREDRIKIRNFLAGMNSPDNALEGVTGLNYFDKKGDARKPVLIGVYKNQNIVSALNQFQTTSNPAVRSYLETKLKKDRVITFEENFMYRINVVFTGVEIRKVSNMDFDNLTCTLDFDLWFRYLGENDLDKIRFLNAAEPLVRLEKSLETTEEAALPSSWIFREKALRTKDGINYRRYRGRGRFQMDFIPERYVYGEHILGISFHHPELDRNNLIYVRDVIGMGNGHDEEALLKRMQDDQVVSRTSGWKIKSVWFFQDLVEENAMGNPEYINITGGSVNYSRFNVGVRVMPDKFILRNIIPGEWVGYMLLLSAFMVMVLPFVGKTRTFRPFLRILWIFQIGAAFLLLLSGEYYLINHLGGTYYLGPIILTFNILWWIIPAFLLSVGVRRFIWNPLEEQTGRSVPHIIRNSISLTIYMLATFGIVAFVFDQRLTSLLATSGVIAMIIGLAIQINISNIFSGIAINVERPFRVGDWVRINDFKEGRVVDINWRATRIKTRDDTLLSIPNSQASESAIENFSSPDNGFFKYFTVHIDPVHPPERVKKILLDAALAAEGVETDPPPSTRFLGLADGVTGTSKPWVSNYLISVYVRDYGKKFAYNESVWTSVWTHLRRAGIRPVMPRQEMHMVLEGIRRKKAIESRPLLLLDELELFEPFSPDARHFLARHMKRCHFYTGESVVRQGDSGNSLFIIEEGVVGIHVKFENRTKAVEVARLGAGDFFGEMALLTGEKRTATIISVTETWLYEITKEDIAPFIEQEPKISRRLSDILTARKIATASRKDAKDPYALDKETLATQLFNRIQNFFGF
ncbi:hypothetical protein DENIS_4663 [Desulfonema ishimotonii]|uniref:Cyclic nucleotide-binding domain-containing protein n=1 Tax=Desulfonema ishimotonii TaxID=45657 RepID=A0A401G3H4_9BACT|nr:ABC transporter substrate-binding protein [Desulfonema ishimotonii]GBC63665.1 hypothetical protein DENIS_4663 [Desulfonema ishimotonii]